MNNLIDKAYNYAIVGVSEDRDKWGRKLFDKMTELGFKTYPVNPKYEMIGNFTCYPSLNQIPEKIDVLIVVVPPVVGVEAVKKAVELGIPKVWMQPGSESDEAIALCRENNLEYVIACFVVDGLRTNW
jgi:uncharacterized protein